jgi:hypothetical protein
LGHASGDDDTLHFDRNSSVEAKQNTAKKHEVGTEGRLKFFLVVFAFLLFFFDFLYMFFWGIVYETDKSKRLL